MLDLTNAYATLARGGVRLAPRLFCAAPAGADPVRLADPRHVYLITHILADAAARAVANSSLVKTSWCGGDPNWGRILDALGYSPATVVESKVDVGYSLPGSKKILYSLKKGRPTSVAFRTLCEVVAAKEFDLHINLNLGNGGALMYAADLTEKYVEFNKGDVSDPASLGG